jgi:hypothetical protein
MNIWSRVSLFMIVLIVILIVLVSIQEYMKIDLIETFKQCVLPKSTTQSIGGFPLQFIIPDEYLQPGITLSDL